MSLYKHKINQNMTFVSHLTEIKVCLLILTAFKQLQMNLKRLLSAELFPVFIPFTRDSSQLNCFAPLFTVV